MTVDSPPPTAAREPVGHANVIINGIMKTFLRTGRYYTSPNRVRPQGAEISQDIDLATSFSNSKLLKNPSQTAAIEPVLLRRASINEGLTPDLRANPTGEASSQGHFITRFLTSTGPADVPDTGPNLACGTSSWTALLTQSMSILGGGCGSKRFNESIDINLSVLNSTNILNNDQSFESYHTPPSSP
jgi:hypothetical protein